MEIIIISSLTVKFLKGVHKKTNISAYFPQSVAVIRGTELWKKQSFKNWKKRWLPIMGLRTIGFVPVTPLSHLRTSASPFSQELALAPSWSNSKTKKKEQDCNFFVLSTTKISIPITKSIEICTKNSIKLTSSYSGL